MSAGGCNSFGYRFPNWTLRNLQVYSEESLKVTDPSKPTVIALNSYIFSRIHTILMMYHNLLMTSKPFQGSSLLWPKYSLPVTFVLKELV